jgi:DNA-directed RNA polymerase specialized sigma24 family protein
MFTEMSDVADREMAVQFERIIRRVKRSMSYRGSYSTQDILASLVTRWVQSGEWERLRQLPPEERKIGESVRRFILDRLDQLRRRGQREELPDDLVIPNDAELQELIELAELRDWIAQRVAELERGEVDPRVKIPVSAPRDVGRALRLQLEGRTQRQIASELGVSLGLVNKRLAEGTSYLVVVQGIESGIGA